MPVSTPAASWSSGLGFCSIEHLLERCRSYPAIHVEEAFGSIIANGKIGFDDGFDGVDNLIRTKPAPDDLADGGVFVGRAAKRDLVKFRALLFDTQNADMADVVMAAGIDAAGNLQLQFADIALTLQRGETTRNLLRHRDGARIGKRAI